MLHYFLWPAKPQIITWLGWHGMGREKLFVPQQAVLKLFFTGFFPSVSTEQVNFGKAGAVLLGVVFPLGVYMSVHPISSSADLHLAGREAGRAEGCEH